MDALQALRQATISNEIIGIQNVDGTFDFGGRLVFPATCLTPYKSQEGKGEFYPLQTLVFFAKRLGPNFKYGEYIRAAKQEGVDTIKLIDRKHLENYLTGKRDTSEYILPDQLPYQGEGLRDGKRTKIGDAMGRGGQEEEEASEETALQAIVSNELQLRNRNTMLSVPGRSFDKVIDVLEVVAREELKQAALLDPHRRGAAREVVAPRSSGRFQRQTATDEAMKQIGAQSLGIQSVGFGGAVKPAPPAGVPPPPPEGAGGGVEKRPAKPPGVAAVIPRPVPKRAEKQKPKMTPLILVPPSVSAILNMHNVKQFLEKGEFVPPEEAINQNPKKPVYERCMRVEGRKAPVKYHIMDRDPTKQEDWDRLVAVFCLGKSWQFKKWPFEGAASGDMVATFLKVAGFFLHYADEPIDPLVKKWNVKMISIGRHDRGTDAAAMRAFWSHVDAFLAARQVNHVQY